MQRKDDSLLDGHVVSKPTEFTLDPNPSVVIGARVDGVEGGATLRIGVVVIILKPISKMIISLHEESTHTKVAGAVIVPASGRIDQPGGIQLFDEIGKPKFGVVCRNLTPSFVIDNLVDR